MPYAAMWKNSLNQGLTTYCFLCVKIQKKFKCYSTFSTLKVFNEWWLILKIKKKKSVKLRITYFCTLSVVKMKFCYSNRVGKVQGIFRKKQKQIHCVFSDFIKFYELFGILSRFFQAYKGFSGRHAGFFSKIKQVFK